MRPQSLQEFTGQQHFLGEGKLLRRMLDIADADAAPVVLDVRTDNIPARTLYEAHGFEVAGLRPRYYRPSRADAYLMVRPARRERNGS